MNIFHLPLEIQKLIMEFTPTFRDDDEHMAMDEWWLTYFKHRLISRHVPVPFRTWSDATVESWRIEHVTRILFFHTAVAEEVPHKFHILASLLRTHQEYNTCGGGDGHICIDTTSVCVKKKDKNYDDMKIVNKKKPFHREEDSGTAADDHDQAIVECMEQVCEIKKENVPLLERLDQASHTGFRFERYDSNSTNALVNQYTSIVRHVEWEPFGSAAAMAHPGVNVFVDNCFIKSLIVPNCENWPLVYVVQLNHWKHCRHFTSCTMEMI